MNAAYTVITSNYISFAKTLGDSIIDSNPDYIFFICLIDREKDFISKVDVSRFILLDTDKIGDKDVIHEMKISYNDFELSCALKPYFAKYLLQVNHSLSSLKYFDSDILVLNKLDNEPEKKDFSIFLTPHFFKPVDLVDDSTNDASLLKLGVFNAGYFEVYNNSYSYIFLDWWKNRLAKYCYDRKFPNLNIFVDQSWLNLVPIYFEQVCIVNNLGYNVSFYNLHERSISIRENMYFINKEIPLVFFHFTGYKYYNHENINTNHPRHNYSNTPFLESICKEYQEKLLMNNVNLTLPKPADKSRIKLRVIFVFSRLSETADKLLKTYFGIRILKITPKSKILL